MYDNWNVSLTKPKYMNGPFLGHYDLKKCPKYRTLGFKDNKMQKLLGPLEDMHAVQAKRKWQEK